MKSYKPLSITIRFFVAVIIIAVSNIALSANFSVDIDRIQYTDSSGLGVDYGFITTEVGPAPTTHIIPNSAITAPTQFWSENTFLWENGGENGTNGYAELTGSTYHMGLYDTTDSWGASIGMWGPSSGEPWPPAAGEWSYSVRLTDFQNTNTPGMSYTASMGTGSELADRTGMSIQATWFSGTYQDVVYENALTIEAEIHQKVDGDTVYQWHSDPNHDLAELILDLDPTTVQLDLKAEFTAGGTEFSGYYRINSDDDTDWILLASHILPDGVTPATGLADNHPYVIIEADSVVPLPGSILLFAPALAGLALFRRRSCKKSNPI